MVNVNNIPPAAETFQRPEDDLAKMVREETLVGPTATMVVVVVSGTGEQVQAALKKLRELSQSLT